MDAFSIILPAIVSAIVFAIPAGAAIWLALGSAEGESQRAQRRWMDGGLPR